jgi:hypothetical protein
MRVCAPREVTAKRARSEWFLYLKIRSTTSVMEPASFKVPSTLRTGIGRESVLVLSRFALTKSRFINLPVAPESTKALRDLTSPVSVVSISTLSLREREGVESSDEAMTNSAGSRLSHLARGDRVSALLTDSRTTWVLSTDSSISAISSTGNTENRLLLLGGGVLLTTLCFGESPGGADSACRTCLSATTSGLARVHQQNFGILVWPGQLDNVWLRWPGQI